MMPSWNFDRVYDLLDDSVDIRTLPTSPPRPRIRNCDSDGEFCDSQIEEGRVSLGSFGKIYEELERYGVSLSTATVDVKEPESEEYITEDGALFSDPTDDVSDHAAPEENRQDVGYTSLPGLQNITEDKYTGLTKKQKRKARKAEAKLAEDASLFHRQTTQIENARVDLQPVQQAQPGLLSHLNTSLQSQYGCSGPNPLGATPGPRQPNYPTILRPSSIPPSFQSSNSGIGNPPVIISTHRAQRNLPGPNQLNHLSNLPASYIPPSVQPPNSGSGKPPVRILGRRAQHNLNYHRDLMLRFPQDQDRLLDPGRLPGFSSKDGLVDGGIHVFIDASNVQIGFNDTLNNTYNTLNKRPGRQPLIGMSFSALALLLERRRPVSRRVLSGSTREDRRVAVFENFHEKACQIGYENHIYEQVKKCKELTAKQRFYQDADRLGWTQANLIRNSAAPIIISTPTTPKWVEQGVDEALHLKICQSVIDCEPSTMVVATGDGAEAEYSDGFPANIERALKKGWKVELVSWTTSLNSVYKKVKHRWPQAFQIIELDEFLPYLIDQP